MPITVLAVGKKHDKTLSPAIDDYQKRLRAPFLTRWEFVRQATQKDDSARLEESERIITKLKGYDFVILLDERGSQYSSPDFSLLISRQLESSQKVAIIIGGAYGVTDELRESADVVWSLSLLVFPHQLVRLILIEQIYRFQMIHTSRSYHNQ